MGVTRRELLVAGAAGGVAIWLPDGVREADAASRRKVPLARDGGFASGVMSGDPAPDAVTLWTRLDDQEAPRQRLRLDVARDPEFRRVVLRRDVPVTALRDHTAKVRVGGLSPDTRYWFRFRTRTTASPVGRTQTAPAPGSQRPVRIGYFACQDFASGHYGAYRRLLELDPDVVVCGGDYIYDRVYEESGYGGVREDRTGANRDSVARTIGDYRAKYRLYRSDPDLRELQRLVPLVAQWDDHEVTDNYAGTLDSSGADDGEEADRYDRARILAGWRAWHEHMPALRFGKGYRTFRRLPFGGMVDLFCLDERSYRDDQPCGGAGFQRCPDSMAPRKFLGDEQLAWFKDGLARSAATWKVVANQLMIMPFDVAAEVPVTVDSWEGYGAERADVAHFLGDRGIKDVAFLTGDIHTFFAGSVLRDARSGPPVAVELVGGSTTSPGTAQTISQTAGGGALPPDLVKALADNVTLTNPWFSYAETRAHGCALLEATPGELRAQYLASRDVTTVEGSRDVRVLARLRVPRGEARVEVQS
ncbi:MAG: alkaline phosphatase D family protein [Solirubrobacterales bacterium]|nr:alkaline phosphatase D family protein [Solirubrobacterales bacterium]